MTVILIKKVWTQSQVCKKADPKILQMMVVENNNKVQFSRLVRS